MIDWKEISMQVQPLFDVYSQQHLILGVSWLSLLVIINYLVFKFLCKKNLLFNILLGLILLSDCFLLPNAFRYLLEKPKLIVYQMKNLRHDGMLACGIGENDRWIHTYRYEVEVSYELTWELNSLSPRQSKISITDFTIESIFYKKILAQNKILIDSVEKAATIQFKEIYGASMAKNKEQEKEEKIMLEEFIFGRKWDFVDDELEKNQDDYFFVIIKSYYDDIPYLFLDKEGNIMYQIDEQELKGKLLKNYFLKP
jgi:hypothetical protein